MSLSDIVFLIDIAALVSHYYHGMLHLGVGWGCENYLIVLRIPLLPPAPPPPTHIHFFLE